MGDQKLCVVIVTHFVLRVLLQDHQPVAQSRYDLLLLSLESQLELE